jgi:hypothetical protein
MNGENNDENITLKSYTYNNQKYKILKYNKVNYNKLLFSEKVNYLNLRSCIFDKNDKLVSIAPEKSIEFNEFIKTNDITDCYYQHFIDGIMINIFYEKENKCWEIATRSMVGGNNNFYDDFKNTNHKDKLTFRNLFFETCKFINLDINTLPIEYSYSFVLQHPVNRIVTPVNEPRLYLVRMTSVENCSSNLYKICNHDLDVFKKTISNTNLIIIDSIKFDLICNFNDVYNYYIDCDYYCVGIMIYNSLGERTKIRNTKYTEVKLLRGNQPKLQYNYLYLKKQNNVSDFLKYYPEHRSSFNNFKNQLYDYTNNLYITYVNCFIKKINKLANYPFEYKIHMYNLHQLYINKLKPDKLFISKKNVIDYVNNLEPGEQMFVINYKYK